MKNTTWAEALEKALIITGTTLVAISVLVAIAAFLNPQPGDVFSNTFDKLKLVFLAILLSVFLFTLIFSNTPVNMLFWVYFYFQAWCSYLPSRMLKLAKR